MTSRKRERHTPWGYADGPAKISSAGLQILPPGEHAEFSSVWPAGCGGPRDGQRNHKRLT